MRARRVIASIAFAVASPVLVAAPALASEPNAAARPNQAVAASEETSLLLPAAAGGLTLVLAAATVAGHRSYDGS